MKWKMWKSGAKDRIVVDADSMDEAFEKARKISPDYVAAQPMEEGESE